MFFSSMRSAVMLWAMWSQWRSSAWLFFFCRSCVPATTWYFSSWFPELCQWSVVLGCGAGMAALCHAWAWLCLGWLSCSFFPGKARGSLAVMPAAWLGQSHQVRGFVQGRQQGERINSSSFCAALSVQLRHPPLLKCKWKFGITYSLPSLITGT